MKQEMSARERLLNALQSKEVDRLPWAPLIDPYFISSIHLQDFHTDIIETMRYLQSDIMERHVSNPLEQYQNVSLKTEQHGEAVRTIYETPVGSVYKEQKKSGNTLYVSKPLVESLEDIKIFTYISEHTTFIPQIEQFVAREKYIGDSGIATVSGNMSPIQNMLQFVAGVENTVYLLEDYPEEMEALFEAMHQANLRQYQALLQYPCQAIFDYEDTSTTVMSRKMFEKYSQPAINAYADLIHDSGKIFITHMCGKLTGFVDSIAKGRQDGIDSVCPPNTGDLYPWDARKAWGKEKVVIGGIDPPSLVFMNAQQTLETVVSILEKVENKKGFILSTGDAVPYGTPMKNLKVISELIHALGEKSLGTVIDPAEVEKILKAQS